MVNFFFTIMSFDLWFDARLIFAVHAVSVAPGSGAHSNISQVLQERVNSHVFVFIVLVCFNILNVWSHIFGFIHFQNPHSVVHLLVVYESPADLLQEVVPQNFSHVDPNIWHSVVDKREEVQFEIFFEKIFRVHHFIAAHKNVQLSFFWKF